MDRLPPETQEQLKKMGSERLRVKLSRAGTDKDRLADMGRQELIEAMAEVMLASELSEEACRASLPASESESGAESVRLKELELEERRLLAEERRAEREAAERQAEREEKRAQREAEERRAQREAEEKRAEREEKRAEREDRMRLEQAKLVHEMKVIEQKAREYPAEDDDWNDGPTSRGNRGEGNLALQTKRFGDTMKHVLPRMPQESAELPQFFDTVEKLYLMYVVPEEVKAKLLIPLLTTQAKSLVNRMPIEKMGDYDELKFSTGRI